MAEQLNLFGEPVRERAKATQGQVGKDNYEEFLAKFDAPKTTDDCYTPVEVYGAVLGWLRERVDLSGCDIVRPFYPGGDYENYPYKDTDVVVDNPPFSILSKILRFYASRGVRFFLFGPQLTLFPKSPLPVTAIACAATIEYANGAKVSTGFLTNLLGDVAAMSAPGLRAAIIEAQDRARPSKAMPVYKYPDEVLTASMLGYMSTHGVEFSVSRSDVAAQISRLASQRACGKVIFGGGLLLSERAAADRAAADRAAAERAAAERAAAERAAAERAAAERAKAARAKAARAKAIVWELSPAEREAVRRCGESNVDDKND